MLKRLLFAVLGFSVSMFYMVNKEAIMPLWIDYSNEKLFN